MPSIDERVVSMAFENAVFEQRVATTMASLGKLNDAIAKTGQTSGFSNIERDANKVTLNTPMTALDKLKAKLFGAGTGAAQGFSEIDRAGNKVTLEGPGRAVDKLQGKMGQLSAGSTFTDIEKASDRVTLGGLTRALDNVQNKFSLVEGAAAVAFGNIASKAAMKGATFAKSFGVGPILDGLHEYETNLKAIQTVQANTDQPLTKINKSLTELNKYSDQTIYNFGEMAKNVGTFTAAGVDLKTSVSSIKGIANMAALSGSSSQQAATAMYQLSQAISSGRVGLQDWNSVVNAGMGGKKLQNALAQTATAMGTLKDGTVKLEGPMKKLTIHGDSFRESIQAKPGQKPWLTSEVLVNTLATLDGRFSKAALSAELTKDGLKKYTAAQVEAKISSNRLALEQKNGVKYTDAQFKSLMHLSDSAFKSATEVKTLGQVFDIAKETIGSGWSASFQSIFGDLGEAKATFTALSQTINGFINANALARNTVLHDWKALGGRTDLIDGIKNVFHTLIRVLSTVKDAFREIFPAKTGKDLANMTSAFLGFTRMLTPSKESLENLKRTLAGVFAVFHIGWTIVKELGKVFFDLLGIVGKGSGGFLNFTGGIGDFLVSVDKALTKGGALRGFFTGLGAVLRVPIELIKSAASAIFSLFGGFDGAKADDVKKGVDNVREAISPLETVVTRVKQAWKQFSGVLNEFKKIVDPWFDELKTQFSNIGTIISDAFKNLDMEKVLLAFQTGLLGGIFITLKNALGLGGKKLDLSGGVFGQIKEVLGGVTGQLEVMQKKVQADILFKIGAAIAVLAAGVFILSKIDAKDLTKAMTAIAVGLGEMAGALKIMSTGGLAGGVQMAAIATGMIILSAAILILSAAVKVFSTMSWDELERGLAGVGGALAVIAAGVKLIPTVQLIPTAAGLVLVGLALTLIATAAKIFAEMKWEELGKGLLGLGGALLALGAGLSLIGPSIVLVGPGLVAAAFGVTLLAAAVATFGNLKPERMLQGILGVGLAVAALGAAMLLIPPTIGLQAAGLILLGIGLTALGAAVGVFGKMKVGTLVKGIVGMAGAIVVLGFALLAMEATLPGSLALMAAAAGLAILVPSIALMGVMPWGTILKGIGGLALAMGTIAVVGLVAAPALLALGAALSVLGLGLVLIGTAVFIAAKGLALLGENGAKGIGVLVSAITAFIALLPTLIINFVKGLVDILAEIAKVAPKVVLALGVILDTVIAFIIEQAPNLAKAVNALITAILNVLAANAGPLISAGWKLIQQLLSGISSNIGSVVTKVGEIITKFLNALATQVPRIVQAGARLLGSFLGGIATALPSVIAQAAKVVGKFIEGITKQLPGVISKGARLVVTFLNGVSSKVGSIIAAGVNLIVKIIDGIGKAIPRVIAAGARLIRRFIDGIANTVPKLVDAGFKAVIRFLNGIARAIRENDDQLIDAMANVGNAIGTGLIKGLQRIGPAVKSAISNLIKSLPKKALSILGIGSPSKVFQDIGQYTMLGLSKGIQNGSSDVNKTMSDSTTGLIDTAKASLDKSSSLLDGIMDTDPVITPVLDLSGVKKEADKLPELTRVPPIMAATSLGQAAAISEDQRSAAVAAAADIRMIPPTVPTVKFEQNNYSPESLSDVEIYRQTNNQLSQAKRVLGITPQVPMRV